MYKSLLLIVASISVFSLQAQDKAIFKASQPGFYQNVIMKDVRNVEESSKPSKQVMRFTADLKGLDVPNKFDLYKSQWHNAPVSQGNSSTCWAFSTISYYESEVFRLTNQKVRLSEIYIVYCEYIEKVKEYIATRGTSAFGEGSEANAVTRILKKYGTIPLDTY
ncbi:MAG TPA: C1 family peptidase, partial [Ignavibacteria bacterium]